MRNYDRFTRGFGTQDIWKLSAYADLNGILPSLHILIDKSDTGLDRMTCQHCTYRVLVGGSDCAPVYIRNIAVAHNMKFHRSQCTIEDTRGEHEHVCRSVQEGRTETEGAASTEIIGQTSIFDDGSREAMLRLVR